MNLSSISGTYPVQDTRVLKFGYYRLGWHSDCADKDSRTALDNHIDEFIQFAGCIIELCHAQSQKSALKNNAGQTGFCESIRYIGDLHSSYAHFRQSEESTGQRQMAW